MRSCSKSVEHVWQREVCVYQLPGICHCLVLESSLYYVCLCVDETAYFLSRRENFGDDGSAATNSLRTDAVSETTLGAGTGWVATTVDFGVNFDSNVG